MKISNYFLNGLAIAILLAVNLAGITGPSTAYTQYVSHSSAQGTILYVKPGTTGSCASWANACDLQNALGVASSGDEIWVQMGLYKPTTDSNRGAAFSLTGGLTLYGGFNGSETSLDQRDWVNNLTVLSGDIDNNDLTDSHGIITDTANIVGDNSYHVISGQVMTGTTVLDGFTLTGGNANGTTNLYDYGGGLHILTGTLILTHMTVIGNRANHDGGGVSTSGNLTIADSTFSRNQAVVYGGGISTDGTMTVTNSTFSGNQANDSGGGIANGGILTVTGSTFTDNQAVIYGGGIASDNYMTLEDNTYSGNQANSGGGLANDGTVTVIKNTFTSNQAYTDGGGLYNRDLHSKVDLSDSSFSSNEAAHNGGGIFNVDGDLHVSGTTLFGNTSSLAGGALYNAGSTNVLNSTFSGNEAIDSGGGIANSNAVTITNTTFYKNIAPDGGGINNQGTITLTNSILANDTSEGNCSGAIQNEEHNIDSGNTCNFSQANGSLTDTDPLLSALANHGGPTLTHALLAGSPAIDSAEPTACPSIDQRGMARPLDGDGDGFAVCDIGSYEFPTHTVILITGDAPDPSQVGDPFDVSFTVTSTLGIPTGVVTVTVSNTATFCSAPLTAGHGYCQITLVGTGVYTLTASYGGSLAYAPSITSEVHTVEAFLPKVYLPLLKK